MKQLSEKLNQYNGQSVYNYEHNLVQFEMKWITLANKKIIKKLNN